MNLFSTFGRGFAWTLGRHAATDAYRHPQQFFGFLGVIAKLLFLLVFWLGVCILLVTALAIAFGGK